MADKIVKLVDKNSNNLYPVAGAVITDAVSTGAISSQAVTNPKIENGAVNGVENNATAIGTAKLALNTVGTPNLRNKAVTSNKINWSTVDEVVFKFDTVAEMKACTYLTDGDLAQTAGYYAANDGGGSYFKVRAKESSDVNDDATIIVLGDLTAEIVTDGTISYDQFGAKGDGTTDDFEKMKAAHEYANDNSLKVIANGDKTYYVKNVSSAIPVKTDIDWRMAHFIIDDSDTSASRVELFSIVPSDNDIDLTGVISSLDKDSTQCAITGRGNLILELQDNNVQDFYRMPQNTGTIRTEYIRIDDDGHILDHVYFQFNNLTSIKARKIDEPFITIKNGVFKTIANTVDSYNYYNRGLKITRSNVIIDNLTHTIEGEGAVGSPYNGFIIGEFCANLTVQNCNVTDHKLYLTSGGTRKGSYDIRLDGVIDASFYNVNQTNSIIDADNISGVQGTNYCKNLVYKRCTLSRIDAHKGVYNLTIDNCIVGYIIFIAMGKVSIKDSVCNHTYFLQLRSDYGGWSDCDIEIINCELRNDANAETFIIYGTNNGATDWHRECIQPNVLIDGFRFNGLENKEFADIIFRIPSQQSTVDYLVDYETNAANGVYPMIMQDYWNIKNVTSNNLGIAGQPRKITLCPIEICSLYVSKTGNAYDRSSSPYEKFNPNDPNFYINIENCELSKDDFQYTTYSSTMTSFWVNSAFGRTSESFINTHRPVLDITVKKCNDLFLNVTGRPVTFHLEDCVVRAIRGQVTGSQNHFLYCSAKNCKFLVKYDIDPSTTTDPGFISRHANTYYFENCSFDIQTWGPTQGDVFAKEVFLQPFTKSNGVLISNLTNINPTFNYSMSEILSNSTIADTCRYWDKTPQKLLRCIAGDSTIRKSGPSANIPTGTAGVISTSYGSVLIPTGATYYDTTSSTTKVFNGTNWV